MGCKKLTYYQNLPELKAVSTANKLTSINTTQSVCRAYVYGFNGMERDDDLSGSGNSYTAQFWQYDSRLGRRWNIDPIIVASRSSYLSFGNNPIIFVDPNGDTEYYNKKGKWIGTDGINNGEDRIALEKSTARIIKSATKEGMNISMNPFVYTDLVQAPNEKIMKNIVNMHKATVERKIEYTLVSDGSNSSMAPGKEGSAPTGALYEQFEGIYGKSPNYSGHTHDDNKSIDGDLVTVGTPEPSYKDILTTQTLEEKNNDFNSDAQSFVIGPKFKINENNKIYVSDWKISFYRGTNTTPLNPGTTLTPTTRMKPNAQISFKKFKKAVKRIHRRQKRIKF